MRTIILSCIMVLALQSIATAQGIDLSILYEADPVSRVPNSTPTMSPLPLPSQVPAGPPSKRTSGIVIAAIGGGLAASGIYLYATAKETTTTITSCGQFCFGFSTTEDRYNARGWSGFGLGVGGGYMVWYGLKRAGIID